VTDAARVIVLRGDAARLPLPDESADPIVAAPRPRGVDVTAAITGYACACPEPDAPTRPAVVLDPFGGTGTTALVASVHGRTGIAIDKSADYCRIARWRTSDPGQRARAIGKPKPKPVQQAGDSLFDGDAAS